MDFAAQVMGFSRKIGRVGGVGGIRRIYFLDSFNISILVAPAVIYGLKLPDFLDKVIAVWLQGVGF